MDPRHDPISLALAAALAVSLSACARTSSPPVVATAGASDVPSTIDPAAAWTSKAAPRRFAEGAQAPDGCFAWSAARGSAACTLGQWPRRRASEPRVVSFLAASGAEPAPLPLQLEGEDPALASEPKIVVTSRSRLDVAMREGSFVELPAGVIVGANAPARGFGPFTVGMRHTRVREEKGSSQDPYLTVVAVRLGGAEPPLLDESSGPSPCAAPALKVFSLSSSVVLIERACRLTGERLDDQQVAAWVCDATQRVCR
jgi:hypothetical protein